jgi:hypothetical protein
MFLRVNPGSVRQSALNKSIFQALKDLTAIVIEAMGGVL